MPKPRQSTKRKLEIAIRRAPGCTTWAALERVSGLRYKTLNDYGVKPGGNAAPVFSAGDVNERGGSAVAIQSEVCDPFAPPPGVLTTVKTGTPPVPFNIPETVEWNDGHWIAAEPEVTVNGEPLYRMYAGSDIIRHGGVWRHEGQEGGLISRGATIGPEAWLDSEAMVTDNGQLLDKASLWDQARLSGNGIMRDEASASGQSSVNDDAQMEGNSKLKDRASLWDQALTSDRAELVDESIAEENSHVKDDARMMMQSRIGDDAVLGDKSKTVHTAALGGSSRTMGDSFVSHSSEVMGDTILLDTVVEGESSLDTGEYINKRITDNEVSGGRPGRPPSGTGNASIAQVPTTNTREYQEPETPAQWRHFLYTEIPEDETRTIEDLKQSIAQEMRIGNLRRKRTYEQIDHAITWLLNEGYLDQESDGSIRLADSKVDKTAKDFIH